MYSTTNPPPRPSYTRFQDLYEISKLLTSFESIERTVPAVLAIVTGALPLRSAILIDHRGAARTMAWYGAGIGAERLRSARMHAYSIYTYLAGAASMPPEGAEEPCGGAVLPGVTGLPADAPDRFITLPLVVGRNPVFGALQMEGAAFTEENLSFLNDIANQLAIALDRHEVLLQAVAAVQRRSDLLSNVAHELRGPLSAIMMAVELLLRHREGDPEVQQRRFESIKRAALRMNLLVRDLLDMASIDARHIQLDLRVHAAAALIDDALEVLRPLASARALRLDTQVAAESGAVLADSARFLQILANLVGNAIKFTPEGGSVTVGAERRGGMVRFQVTDTGPGIPEEELPHLFQRFWQAASTAAQGTGLGLSIVRALVEAQGGEVQVASTLGEGTTFSFTLPAAARSE